MATSISCKLDKIVSGKSIMGAIQTINKEHYVYNNADLPTTLYILLRFLPVKQLIMS